MIPPTEFRARAELCREAGGLVPVWRDCLLDLCTPVSAFAKLRRGGLVRSVRGPGGGYLPAHPIAETRVADIILAVDEPIHATRCAPGSPSGCRQNRSRCLTHDLWEELGNQIHLYLSSVTVADVIDRRILGTSQLISHPLLEQPPPAATASGAD